MPDENGTEATRWDAPIADGSLFCDRRTTRPPLTRGMTPRMRPNRTARAPMTPGTRPQETRPKPPRT